MEMPTHAEVAECYMANNPLPMGDGSVLDSIRTFCKHLGARPCAGNRIWVFPDGSKIVFDESEGLYEIGEVD